MFSAGTFNFAVATAAALIMLIPVGMATVWLGIIKGESPCILCGQERFGMVLIALSALFILRYGPHRKYYAMLILAAFFYLYTTVRHWSNFFVFDTNQGLAESVLGAHTYTWGVFTYWVVLACAGIGLFWLGRNEKLREQFGARRPTAQPISRYAKVVGVVIIIITLLNSAQFFVINGPPPFSGTGCGSGRCPQRFTWDITKTAPNWRMEVWERFKMPTLDGHSPDMVHIPGVHQVSGLKTGSAEGSPMAPTGKLEVLDSTPLGFEATGQFGQGRAGGIAYDEDSGLFGIVSTAGGLYYTNDDFVTVEASAIIDRVNGWDITHTADAMFFGPGKLVAMAWNKTLYGSELLPPDEVDPDEAWMDYLESTGNLGSAFGVKQRMRLVTTRAKAAFSLAVAKDDTSDGYLLVSVPSKKNKSIVIAQYGKNHKLVREGVLKANDEDMKVEDYYPVSAEIADGKLYVLSKTYQSLLVVDPKTNVLEATYELPEIGDYHGLTVKDGVFYILSDVDGKDTVFTVSMPK
ncbi:hypothetical protein BSZ39_12650 [Bowdeniella nasicola]|uniref:Disulfide bond formation protein DsbB n=1 Tax=Bowdeniella nasicola TaxID=208480 RepID=A0A1Q5PX29_9ACTO|nr:hypothetical protein BSZ39_12650 [Bowdeniella nasicola]